MSSLPPPPTGVGGADLLSRIVISLVACSLVTWQLAETANFKPDAAGAWLEKKPLQWYLVLLMLISALDGAVGVALEVARYTTDPEGNVVDLAAVVQGVGLQLFLGKVSQMILSLMIIGLGVSAWSQSAGRQPMKAYSMGATALGLASLFVRDLPPPLVLVAGISCLQRTPKAAQKEERAGGVFSGCFSLRCALRPLLLLACIEVRRLRAPGAQVLQEGQRGQGQSGNSVHLGLFVQEGQRGQAHPSARPGRFAPQGALMRARVCG